MTDYKAVVFSRYNRAASYTNKLTATVTARTRPAQAPARQNLIEKH